MSFDKSKANKILSQSFMEDVGSLTEKDAFDKMLTALDEIKQINEEKENDDQLNVAKEIVKDLSKSYNDSIKISRAKIDFLRDRIKELRSNQ